MKKLLSISIAAYNVEKYLRECLNSFIVRESLQDLLEVIVVDDGSKDATSLIAQEFCENYPNVFRVIQKENGGYGSTINASLRVASGKYYKTVDGDDWLDTRNLEKFLEILKDCTADLVVTKYCKILESTKEERPLFIAFSYDGNEYMADEIKLDQMFAMAQVTYKTSVLKESNLSITENCYYTDMEYVLKPLIAIRTIRGYDLNLYNYRIGREGQSVQLESWKKHIDQAIIVTTNLVEYYSTHHFSSKPLEEVFYREIIDSLQNKLLILCTLENREKARAEILNIEQNTKKKNPSIYKKMVLSKHWKKNLIVMFLRITNYHSSNIVGKVVSNFKQNNIF